MKPLLRIDDYIVDEISIKANLDFDRNKKIEDDIEISCNVLRRGQESKFMLVMDIKAPRKQRQLLNSQYIIRLTIRGLFTFESETPKEIMDKMILTNGVSILYGLARAFASQTTAICRYGKVLLPTMSFVKPISKRSVKKAARKAPAIR